MSLISLIRKGLLGSDISKQITLLAAEGPRGARIDMSNRFVKLTLECFDYKRTPDGMPWAPPKDITNVNLLVKTGALRNGNKSYMNGQEVGVISKNRKSIFHIKDNQLASNSGSSSGERRVRFRPGRPWLPQPGYIPARWAAEAKRAISLQFWKYIKP